MATLESAVPAELLASSSASAPLNRAVLETTQVPSSTAFVLPAKKIFTSQYRSVYHQRLFALRPHLLASIRSTLLAEGGAAPAVHERIVDAHPGVQCVVVGTLYKDMPLKPTILDEYEDNPEEVTAATAARSNFCGSDDTLVLEDDHGRITLNFSEGPTIFSGPDSAVKHASAAGAEAVLPSTCTVAGLVSGLVVGVQGTENETGEFTVSRIFFPDLVPLPPTQTGGARVPVGTALICASAPAAAAAAEAARATPGASDPTSGDAMTDAEEIPAASSAGGAVGIALPRPPAREGDTFVAFLSDLRLGVSDEATPAAADAAAAAATSGAGAESERQDQGARAKTAAEISLLVDMASDFILGLCAGSSSDAGADGSAGESTGASAAAASRISHVVVAGGAFAPRPPSTRADNLYLSASAAAAAAAKERARVSASIAALDLFATRLSASVPVTVVPGASDPSNAALPQQPLHPCLFASAATYSSFQSTTNPAVIALPHARKGEESKGEGKGSDGSLMMIGSGGQNVSDMLRFSTLTPLSALALCLRSRVLAPTAPDTLPCYPYTETDPFVLIPGAGADAGAGGRRGQSSNSDAPSSFDLSHVSVPDVLFAGCQSVAGAAIVATPTAAAASSAKGALGQGGSDDKAGEVKETLLLAVPSFAVTGQMVLLNTRTLAPTVVSFGGIEL